MAKTEDISQLEFLRDHGVISKGEFERERDRLSGARPMLSPGAASEGEWVNLKRTGNLTLRFGLRDDPQYGSAMVFENPANGHREEISELSWLWVLLFGALYLVVKGLVLHAVVWFVVGAIAIMVFGPAGVLVVAAMSVIYAISVQSLLRSSYLRKGWVVPGLRSTDAPVVERRPTSSSGSPTSVADELSKLAALKSSGVLTDAEFQRQKERLLS